MARTTTSPELSPTRIVTGTPCDRWTSSAYRLTRLLHPERRVARPHRVVLVGEGRAEERHDPVAHDLVHGALVAVDGLHHVLEHRVQELARLLRIAVGEQLHRALEVGEEDGDLLALALQGGLRGEDLLGEVLGGVGIGRRELRGRAASAQPGPRTPDRTCAPEGAGLPQCGTGEASGAAHCPQNFAAGEVLVLAPGTLHLASYPPRMTSSFQR